MSKLIFLIAVSIVSYFGSLDASDAADADCKICFSLFDDEFIRRTTLNCGHLLCETCLVQIVSEHKELSNCPFCRRAIEEANGNSIFPKGDLPPDVQASRDATFCDELSFMMHLALL